MYRHGDSNPGTNPARGRPVKRSRRKPIPGMAEFWATVTENGVGPCVLAQPFGEGCCQGRAEAHHWVPKQRLQNDRQKADPRNGVCLCSFHHQQVEWRRVDCPRPPELDDFLADHGLLESGRPDPKLRAA